MSQENVEIVRRFFDAWGREEYPGPVEFMHPEIEFVNPAGAVEPGTRSGIAAFSRSVERIFEGFEAMSADVSLRSHEPPISRRLVAIAYLLRLVLS